jgi:pyruvate carboxylase
MAAPTTSLHPPRLAAIFAGTPSAPGTPVHSIQSMRRKAAGHGGPLTKILVANRGVHRFFFALSLFPR